MPFKSKAQWRACFAADDPNWDCREWADSTPSYKELPKKKKKEKKAEHKVENQTFTDSDGSYNVADLYELAKSKGEPQNLDISDLLHNLEPSPEEKGEELPGHPDFVARAEAAGTLPGIAVNYPDGKWIADGVHRLWKAQQDNKKEYPAYVLDKADIGSVKQANINALLEAKKESDRKNYSAKHDILRKLISQNPANFIVDSAEGNISGITHTPTGFQIHMPSDTIPAGVALKQAADSSRCWQGYEPVPGKTPYSDNSCRPKKKKSKKEKKATAPGTLQSTHSTISTKSASTMLSHFLSDSFNQRVNGVTSGIFKENAYGVPDTLGTTPAPVTQDPLGQVQDPLNPGVPAAQPQPAANPAQLKAEAQSFVNPKGSASLNAAAPPPTAQAANSQVAPGFGIGSFAGGNEPPTGFNLQNTQFGTGAGVDKPLTVTASLNSLVAGSPLFIN